MAMERKKLIICQIIAILILVGFGAWLFVAFGSVGAQIGCFLDQIDVMKNLKGQTGAKAGSIANLIPASVINLVRTYLPLIAVFVVVPAALIAIMELLVAFLASNPCKNSSADEKCAAIIIMLLQVVLVIGLICYLVIGGAGIAINLPFAADQLKLVTNVCDTGLPQMATEITNADVMLKAQEVKLAAVPAAAAASVKVAKDAVANAQLELGEAKKGLTALQEVCKCVKDTFSLLGTFIVPGLGCAAGCLILIFLNCAACCSLCCCGKKKKAPAPNAGSGKSGVELSQEV